MVMTRELAIREVISDAEQIAQEFACSAAEHDATHRAAIETLMALGVTAAEIEAAMR